MHIHNTDTGIHNTHFHVYVLNAGQTSNDPKISFSRIQCGPSVLPSLRLSVPLSLPSSLPPRASCLVLQNTIAFYLVSPLICSVFLDNTARLGKRRRDVGLLEGMPSMHNSAAFQQLQVSRHCCLWNFKDAGLLLGLPPSQFRSCCGPWIKFS